MNRFFGMDEVEDPRLLLLEREETEDGEEGRWMRDDERGIVKRAS